MNLYLSAIGFSDMDSMKESRFIKAAVRQCIDEGYILKGRPIIAPTEKVGDGASTSRKNVDNCFDKHFCTHN